MSGNLVGWVIFYNWGASLSPIFLQPQLLPNFEAKTYKHSDKAIKKSVVFS